VQRYEERISALEQNLAALSLAFVAAGAEQVMNSGYKRDGERLGKLLPDAIFTGND